MLKPTLGSQLQLGHPLAYGLIGLWLFNEGPGNNKVFDSSGNGNEGTNTNVVWSVGPNGLVLNYVEANSPYTLTDEIALFGFTTQDFTVVCSASSTQTSYQGYVTNLTSGGSGNGWGLVTDVGGRVRFTTWNGGVDFDGGAEHPTLLTDGAWHQLVGIRRSGTNYIYVDGIYSADDGGGEGNPAASGENLIFGTYYSNAANRGSFELDGKLGYVYIFNRALSSSEIALLYREPFCMFERDPIELWSAATLGAPPVGNAGIMTPNTGFWGPIL